MQIHAFINKQLFLFIYVVLSNLKHSLLNCYKYNLLSIHERSHLVESILQFFTPLLRHVLHKPWPIPPVNVNTPIDFFQIITGLAAF